jgi:hypothetical protein
VSCVYCTGHNRANARIGWGPGLGLLPLLKGSQPSPSPALQGIWLAGPFSGLKQLLPQHGAKKGDAWSSRVRTATWGTLPVLPAQRRPPPPPLSSPASPGTLGCPPACPAPTCPSRRAWARRLALPLPPPGSSAALFPVQQYNEGGTGGERSAELSPGLGLGCGCERQSPVS